jgi:sensor domain CHASE-containing protein
MNKMDKIEEFTLQQVIDNQERVIKEQKEDIKRLQAQLDREIHTNRKLVKALKEYANTEPYVLKEDDWGKQCLDIRKIAQKVLKEIGEEV